MKSALLATAGMLAAGLLLAPSDAAAQDVACPVKIGGVLPLTGPNGTVGQLVARSAQLAIDHINEGGGVKGCDVQLVARDDQGQPTVGVDAARYLVDVEGVQAITGTISSGITLPILTSVTVPSKITHISCCSTAATFTELAAEGKTEGFFFRTMPTVKNQAYATAKITAERGYKRVALIYINTDFGAGMLRYYKQALDKLGVELVTAVAYNENQPSYRAEVNQALATNPDAVFFNAFPQDGATMVREWLSLGGSQNIILNNSLRSDEFVNAVGAQYLQKAFGMDAAAVEGPTVDVFRQAFLAATGVSSDGPGIHPQYDATVILALAMNIAGEISGPAIRDAMRKAQDPEGEIIGTGPDDFRKALALIAEGKPIRYSGASGPLTFDENGDVSGPALIWNVTGQGAVAERILSLEEMNDLVSQIDN